MKCAMGERAHQMTIANNDKKLLDVITPNFIPKNKTEIDRRRNSNNGQSRQCRQYHEAKDTRNVKKYLFIACLQ